MVAAKAWYVLASAPGIRFSTRMPWPWPTMRKPSVRLSTAQPTAVGAQLPGRKRR